MGSILSAISDDINEYRWLCQHFREKVQHERGVYGPDCYGPHAKLLERRYARQREVGEIAERREHEQSKAAETKRQSDAAKVGTMAFQPSRT